MIYKTIIADDEALAREILQKFLSFHQEIEIVAVCADGKQAKEAIEKHQPDLVFLDIQMPEINGIELASSVSASLNYRNHQPIIVFVTAFDNYAVQAFEANAIDYLLKPFDKERFEKTFQKVKNQLQMIRNQAITTDFDKYSQFFLSLMQPNFPEIITVKDGGRIQLLKVIELTHIEAEGNYIALFTEKSKHLQYETLTNFETKLNPKNFIRIHRSTIVNLHFIKEIQSHFNGDYSVILKNGKVLRLSRNYKERLNL